MKALLIQHKDAGNGATSRKALTAALAGILLAALGGCATPGGGTDGSSRDIVTESDEPESRRRARQAARAERLVEADERLLSHVVGVRSRTELAVALVSADPG